MVGDIAIEKELNQIKKQTFRFLSLWHFLWKLIKFDYKNQNEKWDGSYNGEYSPMGVYIWKAKYQYRIEGAGSEINEESGTVTLIR